MDGLKIWAGDLLDLTLPLDAAPRLAVPVAFDGVERTLLLRAHSLRSGDFRLLVQGEAGTLEEVKPPPPRTYQGTVLERPGSRVAASLINGQLTAHIHLPDESWSIQPVSKTVAGAPRGRHVVFRKAGAMPGDWRCGNDERMVVSDVKSDQENGSGYGDGADMAAFLALDADVEFYNANNSSIEGTVADMEMIINAVNVIYRRDVNIVHVITAVVVRTAEPDPYTATSPNSLLCQFRATWNSAPESSIQRDVAHLFTGKDLDGTTIGVAWTGVVCNVVGSDGSGTCPNRANLAYGLVQSRYTGGLDQRVALSAHELGHTWSAQHCDADPDCNIMCANAAQCNGNNTSFGSRSIGSITGYRSAAACLRPSLPNVVYVSWSNTGEENGSVANPFNTVGEAAAAVAPMGWIVFLQPGSYPETVTVSKATTFLVPQGTVTLGE